MTLQGCLLQNLKEWICWDFLSRQISFSSSTFSLKKKSYLWRSTSTPKTACSLWLSISPILPRTSSSSKTVSTTTTQINSSLKSVNPSQAYSNPTTPIAFCSITAPLTLENLRSDNGKTQDFLSEILLNCSWRTNKELWQPLQGTGIGSTGCIGSQEF